MIAFKLSDFCFSAAAFSSLIRFLVALSLIAGSINPRNAGTSTNTESAVNLAFSVLAFVTQGLSFLLNRLVNFLTSAESFALSRTLLIAALSAFAIVLPSA